LTKRDRLIEKAKDNASSLRFEELVRLVGQFRVRLPRTLHSRLAIQARREGVSLNSQVTMILAQG
jgi:predicted HicB family RNase H-like nuclease